MTGLAVDLILGALVLLSVLLGMMRGFIKELLSLFVWILSLYLALSFSKVIIHQFPGVFPEGEVGLILAFVLLFILCFFMLSILSYIISKTVRRSPLRAADISLGSLFGLFRGVLVAVMLVWGVGRMFPALANSGAWQHSVLVHYLIQVPDLLQNLSAEKLFESLQNWLEQTLLNK